MKTTHLFFTLAFALLLPLHAQEGMPGFNTEIPGIKPAKRPVSDERRFTLLPPGLHPNPQVNYTILTELTNAGQMLPEPSVDKPVYYIAHSMGQQNGGDGIGFSQKILFKSLQEHLLAALASNGYLPGDLNNPGKAPTQVLIFSWGLHNRKDMMDKRVFIDLNSPNDRRYLRDPMERLFPGAVWLKGSFDDNSVTDIEIFRGSDASGNSRTETISMSTDEFENLLDRAKIVGGQRLAEEVARRLLHTGRPSRFVRKFAIGGGFLGHRGDIAALLLNDCNYMHVAAYDLEALMNGQRNPLPLLWITRVSTVSLGINFRKSMPMMINTAAYYFGRETDGLVTLRKRAYKSAKVEIGDPTVVEYISGTAKPATSGTTPGKP